MNFAVAVDLGGTNLRIAAVSEAGELWEKITTGTKVALGRDVVIAEMTAAIEQLAAKFSASGQLLGAGIGVPGIIDQRSGLLRRSPNLPGWHDYPVRQEIERRLGSTVALENDANCAALGEAWLGAARHAEHAGMITLGTGVGGGIVQCGRLWRGLNGMAGEVGHITVDPDGPKCNCGNHGCVEQFASASAIVRQAREAIAAGGAPQLSAAAQDPAFDARSVDQLARQGDKPARAIFRKAGWALGVAVADLVNVLNLHMYVIGGGVADAWDAFAPAMFAELQRRSFVYTATAPAEVAAAIAAGSPIPLELQEAAWNTIVTRAKLGGDAGLYGAARLPMIERLQITGGP
jgi:glucokinase